jgi:hypothetical protein
VAGEGEAESTQRFARDGTGDRAGREPVAASDPASRSDR